MIYAKIYANLMIYFMKKYMLLFWLMNKRFINLKFCI